MLAAEDNFGIACPDFVKTENKMWLNTSRNGATFGYDGPSHPWGTTVNTTPSAMVQLAMDDVSTTNAAWVQTEDFIAATWTASGWYGDLSARNYYGRYALTKALRLAHPSAVTILRNGFHWYDDETCGIRRVVTDQQNADGSWYGNYHSGDLGYELSTAWAIVMLTPSLFTQPPEAAITAPAVWGYGTPLTLTAERSFSVNPLKKIAKYMWDFDNDGNFDLITVDPLDPNAVWTWPDPHPAVTGDVPIQVTVHLKVVDDADPPQSDETFKTIIIAEPPHAPFAHAIVPPTASTGVWVWLSGSESFDIDPMDVITQYQWDFNNDDEPDLVTNAASFYMRFMQPGEQTVGLRVVDNGVMNNDIKMTSEWDYATCSVSENQAPVANAGTVACANGACGGSAMVMVLKVSSLCGGSASSTTFRCTVTWIGTSPVTAGCGSGHVHTAFGSKGSAVIRSKFPSLSKSHMYLAIFFSGLTEKERSAVSVSGMP